MGFVPDERPLRPDWLEKAHRLSAVSVGAILAPQAPNRPTSLRRLPVRDCQKSGPGRGLPLAAETRTPRNRRTHPLRRRLRNRGTMSLREEGLNGGGGGVRGELVSAVRSLFSRERTRKFDRFRHRRGRLSGDSSADHVGWQRTPYGLQQGNLPSEQSTPGVDQDIDTPCSRISHELDRGSEFQAASSPPPVRSDLTNTPRRGTSAPPAGLRWLELAFSMVVRARAASAATPRGPAESDPIRVPALARGPVPG